jgi:hypothetical protein
MPPETADVVESAPAKSRDGRDTMSVQKPAEAPRHKTEPTEKPAIFVPAHAPDDPGVPQAESDEGPSPLERLRAAQIR